MTNPPADVHDTDTPDPLPSDADRERIKAAIGYDPISVSIAGHPGIRETYRTVDDRDDLVRRLLPVLAEVRAEMEQRLREQIATDIEAVLVGRSFDQCYADGLTRAAGIAREVTLR